ncbi:probable fibrosin-1 [Spea bombifrons]|uniref:probable fibrosin-1 n=1 Tax=Spea bombifrons TaxID=233779 RepID=UPI002349CAFC|nr:probable fibrosin-1 [Spea bombifrons]
MEAQPHTPRARSGPRVPRRRSKSQRDRRRGPSPANSSSSSPEPALWPRPQRKKRRRRKERDSAPLREEDLIDGFCISSYGSLEAMQRDASLDSAPQEETFRKRPTGKRKRSDDPSSEDPGTSSLENRVSALVGQRQRRGHKEQEALSCGLDAGYICDAESSCDEQVPGDDLAVSFTVSTSPATLPVTGSRFKLLVQSKVSGLDRSCERSQEQEIYPAEPKQCPPAAPRSTPRSPPHAVPSASPKAQPTLSQPATAAAPDPNVNSSSRSSLPKTVSVPQTSQRPPTPSVCLSGHSIAHNFPSALRPPSHHHMGLFAPSPGLPPPPPLLQVTGHPASAVLSEHDVIGQNIGSRFLSAPGGGAELGTAIRPMYQFHQHNHQHTHQHTHQHFTPYPHNVGSATFEKYPGKIESLYRQNFFQPFSPVLTTLPPVLPPTVSFGSLQGAFQPKSTNSELASQCSVPPAIGHKAPQLQDQFKPRRSGRWCAMHVRVAYMILRHQERLKLAHGTHKSDFRGDLLSCVPTGLSSHDLTRPSSLFNGAVPHAPGQYQVAPPAVPSFLHPPGHMDTFIRTSGFSPLASLTNGAFGGLGSPSYNPSTMFNQKESPAVHSFSGPHDPWNRLHRTPPSFPTAPPPVCAKASDLDSRNATNIKDEKERDLLFSRLARHPSPLTPTQRHPGGDERGPSRTISPYVGVRPGSSSEMKPRLTPEHPSKVKVKEEPEPLFEVGRSPLPGLHLPHPSPPFDRLRGAFLGEQYPHTLEAWRDIYRRADPAPLRLPLGPPQRLYEQREERAHILREDFERARVYGLPAHVAMQPAAQSMLGSLYPHPGASLINKTPPMNLLTAPPPLISNSRPGSPHRRDLYKERDSR